MGYSLLSMKWDDGLAQGEVWLSAPEKEQEFRLISHRRWVSKQLEDAWEQRRLLSFALQLWHLHVLGAASSGTGQGCSGAPRWSHSMAFTAIYSLLPNLWGHFIVQLLSRVQLFATLWTAVLQASLFFTMSRSLLRFMSIESVMPSNHLILCRPLLSSCHQSFPASGATASNLRPCATHVLPSWFCSCCSPN